MKIKDYNNVMDPQKLSQLNPKLREAYERVMGTAIPQPQVTPASQRGEPDQAQTPLPPPAPIPDPTPPAPQPQSQPEPKPTPSPTGEPTLEPQPVPSVPQPIAEPQPAINPQQPQFISTPQPIPSQPASNFTRMNSEAPAAFASATFDVDATPAPQAQAIVLKKKRGIMMPVLFGITGLIFIVIYTLFWTKIFNLKLPFLP